MSVLVDIQKLSTRSFIEYNNIIITLFGYKLFFMWYNIIRNKCLFLADSIIKYRIAAIYVLFYNILHLIILFLLQ